MDENEQKLIQRMLGEPDQIWMPKEPMSPKIKSLIDRGYLKLSKVRIGPLGIYTGEEALVVTEAAQVVLNQLQTA